MRKFLSTLAMASLLSSALFATEVAPKESVTVEDDKESIGGLVISSFRDNNHTIYIQGVAPSYEEFVEIRQTMTGRKVDPNRSKMRYYRKLDGIAKNWQNVADRIQRYNIDWDKVKFIDMTHDIDQTVSDKLKKKASRISYLNFSHKDKAFSIIIRSCFKFDDWKCGGKIRFSR